MNTPILLFDADGVLTLPEEVFSDVYARSRGLDVETFNYFFKTKWKPIVTGKKDLKESILENPELWQWEGDVDSLLDLWFKTEDIRNIELIKIIHEHRANGIPAYLATEQEKYRGEYMKEVMFKDLFAGYFITGDMGVSKTDSKFFEIIINRLTLEYPGIVPSQIVFFDDSQSKVDTARSAGLDGRLYTHVQQVKNFQDDELGLS
jgi:FMN phosphatase YigB (HAD superfamily)